MDTPTRAEIRARSILSTRNKYSWDVLKDDDIMRRGSRGYSAEIKQAIIDKQDDAILRLLNSTHEELTVKEIAEKLGYGHDLVKNKLQKLNRHGKIIRIKIEGIPANKPSIFYKGRS